MELLTAVKASESFIPEAYGDKLQADRIRAVSVARKKLAIQQAMRLKFPEMSNAEFKKNWVALNAMVAM